MAFNEIFVPNLKNDDVIVAFIKRVVFLLSLEEKRCEEKVIIARGE